MGPCYLEGATAPPATGNIEKVLPALFAGRRFAVSLSFDDARPSQLEVAVPILDRAGARATFYVLPKPMRRHA
ncbi:MAG TPA: hypothetical protein VEJ84_03865, partial [Acidimicrobiales bacterium]|nr:hypothetical protein [Acidimicrobiales bacterium]